jgi:hypothetical protein
MRNAIKVWKYFYKIFFSLSLNRYQNELPIKIKARGKDPYINHDELVQCMKWKLAVSF